MTDNRTGTRLKTIITTIAENRIYQVILFVDLIHIVAGTVQFLPPRASIKNILTLWFTFAMANATIPLLKSPLLKNHKDIWKYWIIVLLSCVINWYVGKHLYITENLDYGMQMVYFLLFPVGIAGFTLSSRQFSWIAAINLTVVVLLYLGTQSTSLALEKWSGQHMMSLLILAGVSYVLYIRLNTEERNLREIKANSRELALYRQHFEDVQQQEIYETSLKVIGEDALQTREELYHLREEIPTLVDSLSQTAGKIAISLIVGTVITEPKPNSNNTAVRMIVISKNGGKYHLIVEKNIMPFDVKQGSDITTLCEMRTYHRNGADLINHNVLRFIGSTKIEIYRQISEIITSEI